MKKAFILSKENLYLAESEIIALLKPKFTERKDNFLIASTESKLYPRLAYTKKVIQIIKVFGKENIDFELKSINWNKYYEKNFSVKCHGKSRISEKKIGGLIYDKLNKPKVNLKNPKSQFELYFFEDDIIIGKTIWENDNSYMDRRAHLRPELHPTSLNPKLAKACINLTGIKNGNIIDPFCGSGGILIEAGLMNLKPIGYDIDKIMINRSKINLKHYKIKDFELKQKDATKLKRRINYIVTDPPYGKNTKNVNVKKTYHEFIKYLGKNLTGKGVIIHNNTINLNKVIKKNGLLICNKFQIKIHKSMTRNILVLSKK